MHEHIKSVCVWEESRSDFFSISLNFSNLMHVYFFYHEKA